MTANIHHEVSRQGALTYTLSSTDVAVQGEGFFVVEDSKGGHYLTRAGSFVVDGQSGDLVNTAGFALMGFPSVDGEEPVITLNDTAGLEVVNLDYMNMRATPSTTGDVPREPRRGGRDRRYGHLHDPGQRRRRVPRTPTR